MNRFLTLCLLLLLAACGPADPGPLSVQPAILDEEWATEWWQPRHAQKLADKDAQDIELIFIGDSITHGWEEAGGKVWDGFYGQRKAFNLGFAGDRTENVLWRLENGAVDGLSPKLVVMMIGTNNTGHRKDSAADTVMGIEAILQSLETRLPETHILLLGVFPRGPTAAHEHRIRNNQINEILEAMPKSALVSYKDIGREFLSPNGDISEKIMPDFLHLSPAGYRLWAAAIEPDVARLLGEAIE